MDKRRNTRLDINLSVELISGERIYKGSIENFSSGGLGIRSIPLKDMDNIAQGDKVTVRFKANSEDTLNICYKIKWLKKDEETASGLIYKMGMEYSFS